MKKRFEEWLKLTGDNNSRSANASVTPIRTLDLRGFQEMEDKLLIYMPRRGELPPDVEEFVDDLSKRTFGVTRNDTLFKVPAGYDDLPLWSDERQNIDDRYDAHEGQFETADATDDEVVAVLLRLGLDFRDAQAKPLLCAKLFCRQAEAAAKRIMGKMPDRDQANLNSWTKALERDAEQHMKKKKRLA